MHPQAQACLGVCGTWHGSERCAELVLKPVWSIQCSPSPVPSSKRAKQVAPVAQAQQVLLRLLQCCG